MILDQLIDKFSNRPGIKTEQDGNTFAILPRDDGGFKLWIREEKGRKFTVGFDRWQETFTDATQALACFALGLSKDCRLKVYSKLGTRYHWIVQQYVNGLWVDGPSFEDLNNSVRLWPFKKTQYLQNDLLSEERRQRD
jgi:hypothetical protein